MTDPIPFEPRNYANSKAATPEHIAHLRAQSERKLSQADLFVPSGALFVDYVTCTLPLDWKRPIHGGMFVSLRNVEGGDAAVSFEEEDEDLPMEVEYRLHKRRGVEGSWSARIQLRTVQRGFVRSCR